MNRAHTRWRLSYQAFHERRWFKQQNNSTRNCTNCLDALTFNSYVTCKILLDTVSVDGAGGTVISGIFTVQAFAGHPSVSTVTSSFLYFFRFFCIESKHVIDLIISILNSDTFRSLLFCTSNCNGITWPGAYPDVGNDAVIVSWFNLSIRNRKNLILRCLVVANCTERRRRERTQEENENDICSVCANGWRTKVASPCHIAIGTTTTTLTWNIGSAFRLYGFITVNATLWTLSTDNGCSTVWTLAKYRMKPNFSSQDVGNSLGKSHWNLYV